MTHIRPSVEPVEQVTYSPDGTYLAVLYRTDMLIYQNGSETLYWTLPHSEQLLHADWSPNSSKLLVGYMDGTIVIYNVNEKVITDTIDAYTDVNPDFRVILDVAWSPNGTRFATTAFDGVAKLWDASSGEVLYEFEDKRPAEGSGTWITPGTILSIVWSPDGLRLAGSAADDTIRVWEATNGTIIQDLGDFHFWAAGNIRVAWSPNGQLIAGGDYDIIAVWDTDSWKPISTFEADHGSIETLSWSASGTQLVAGGERALVWNLTSGESIELTDSPVTAIKWSPNGKWLVGCLQDQGSVWLWDATTGEGQTIFERSDSFVTDVIWSPDGEQVVASYDDGYIVFLDMDEVP